MVHRSTGSALVLAVLVAINGCGLSVTHERPSYEELDPVEKSAVQTVLKELRRFDTQVKNRTAHNISEVVDRERIHVSFEGAIFSGNLGDGTIHVAIWENLNDAQRALVAQWFKTSEAGAAAIYRKFFYQFMAVVQGAKQLMYKVHTPTWVYHHRTLWSIERDSIRTALAHYIAEGRRAELWPFLSRACTPIKSRYAPQFSDKFSKKYLQANFKSIYSPDAPSGYMYFICRWIDQGKQMHDSLGGELDWLINLPD